MTKSMRHGATRRGHAPWALGIACLALVGAGARAEADPRVAGAGAPRVVAMRTNTELLVAAARAVAAQLTDELPLPPGSRIALQPEGQNPVDTDITEALLLALNGKGFTCLIVTAAAPESSVSVVPAATGADTAAVGAGLGAKEAYLKLQEERKAQAARADSVAAVAAALAAAHPATVAAAHGLPQAAVGLPLLTYRVAEGRVDYVRLFRSGIFGAERFERRATTRVTLKLHAPGDDAVRWSASADTTLSDVIAKTDAAALEDRTRSETRPIQPQSNLKKIVEPALVVTLIAGLVALFYQNRP